MWAESDSRSTSNASTSTGRRPTVWQASVWNRTCDSRARRAASATCWSVPSSWFACWTLASSVPGRANLGGVAIHVQATVGVHGDHHDLEAVALEHVAHASDRWMLRRADHDARAQLADGAHAAPDRECDRLGAAGGEDELVRLRVDRLGHHAARVVDQASCLSSGAVDVQRIAERIEGGHHRIAGRREEGSGRRCIEVDVAAHRRPRLPPASAGHGRVREWRVPCP